MNSICRAGLFVSAINFPGSHMCWSMGTLGTCTWDIQLTLLLLLDDIHRYVTCDRESASFGNSFC